MAGFVKQMQPPIQPLAPLSFGMAEERAARSVFVGNIPYEATEEQLKEIFNQAGPVVSFRMVYDRETGKPKGYGFCEYQDLENAQCAMRNLNNHDFNGRPLRVGIAVGEQGKEEGGRLMQQAFGGPLMESPFGDPVETEKAPEAISRAVASLPPEQMFELMKQMKLCIQNNPNEARQMLLQNPQLAYALLQAQIVMKIVDPQVALAMLHRPTEQIPPLLPSGGNNGNSQQPNNMDPRPFGPSVGVSRGGGAGPLLGPPGPSIGGPTGGIMGPNPEFGLRGPVEGGPRIRGGLLGDMPLNERVGGVGPGPRGPGGFLGDPRNDPRGGSNRPDMGGLRDPGHMMNMGGPGARPEMGMGPGMGLSLRHDANMGPRRDIGPGMGHVPRMDMGQRPRMDMGPGMRMEMGPRDMGLRGPLPEMRDSDMRTARIQPMNAPGPLGQSAGPSPGPGSGSLTSQISPQDQEKAALIMQVLQLSDEQISMLPSDQRQSILILKEQIARSANK